MIFNNMPVLPLKGITVFPNMVMGLPIGRKISIEAVEAAKENDEMIFLVPQKSQQEENPGADGLLNIGTVAKIRQVLSLPANITHVIIEGVNRAYVRNVNTGGKYYVADADVIDEDENFGENNIEVQSTMRAAKDLFDRYIKLSGSKLSEDVILTFSMAKTPGKLADNISASITVDNDIKQELISDIDPMDRLKRVISILSQEIEILALKNEIEAEVKSNMEKSQKEYYLREQLKVIEKKLGEDDDAQRLKNEFQNRAMEKELPDYAFKTIVEESEKMAKTPITSPEFNVIRNYIETILSLPWTEKTRENKNLISARKALDKDHYGLEDVKERILEFIAVRINSQTPPSSIICLSGPPGVGKTSIAKSIAKATGRKYVRMSLGGVRDESEIRGHRRTYVGAMCGRIMKAMRQAGTVNPLILLDEVDKLGASYNGDPSSALLEVLDPEQNNTFTDHYLDMPYDLSKVLFICTANDSSNIPGPLRDRMDIIQLSGYTIDEKRNIADKYLYPKQLKLSGLKKSQLSIEPDIIDYIIDGYTREAGVRQLERTIGRLCAKAVVEILEKGTKKVKITKDNIADYIGIKKFTREKANLTPMVGIVRGLAWTSVGGETLEIEVNTMAGSGKFELTGNMGNVMKESAKAGISYIRSQSANFNIDGDFYKNTDIHIHIPEGAVPKDGPSAGITMATAMISALTGAPVKNNVAMTGEITIRGRVLPIGGLKEKTIAARQAGIDTVIIPALNKPQMEELPDEIKNSLKFVLVETMEDVLKNAIAEGGKVWK